MREVHSEKKSKRAIDHGDFGLSRRLGSYAAAAGSAVALFGIPDYAAAKIVYTPVDIKLTGSVAQYELLPDGVHPALALSFIRCSYLCMHLQGTGESGGEIIARPPRSEESGYRATDLAAGEKIGASASFIADAQFAGVVPFGSFGFLPYGKWFNATNGYFGFQFSIDGKTHYGWGRMTTSTPSSDEPWNITATLTGFAYETIPNRRILAGQEQGSYAEPEPGDDAPSAQAGHSTLGALALGAAGVPIWRKEEDALVRTTGV